MARDNLSELEGCVLGVVVRMGPCTAYAVRKEFRSSLTTSWRASAGTIYPVLQRLAAKRLVIERQVKGDARGTRTLSATKAGEAALADWISDPDGWIGEPAADPIRTRLQFMDLSSIPKLEQIDSWIARTEACIRQNEDESAAAIEAGELFRLAADRGTWHQLDARKRWLLEMRDQSEKHKDPIP